MPSLLGVNVRSLATSTMTITWKGTTPGHNVNWILVLDFPYIRSIPKVKLQGSVKKSIKEAWDRILSIDYKKTVGIQTFDDGETDLEGFSFRDSPRRFSARPT